MVFSRKRNPTEEEISQCESYTKIGPSTDDFIFCISWQFWHRTNIFCWNFDWYQKSTLRPLPAQCAECTLTAVHVQLTFQQIYDMIPSHLKLWRKCLDWYSKRIKPEFLRASLIPECRQKKQWRRVVWFTAVFRVCKILISNHLSLVDSPLLCRTTFFAAADDSGDAGGER